MAPFYETFKNISDYISFQRIFTKSSNDKFGENMFFQQNFRECKVFNIFKMKEL